MKQIIYMISLFLLSVSCSDFLDYKDKDKVIPDELDHYSELVLGELVQKSVGETGYNLWYMSVQLKMIEFLTKVIIHGQKSVK